MAIFTPRVGFQKCLDKTAPWLTPSAMHNPSGWPLRFKVKVEVKVKVRLKVHLQAPPCILIKYIHKVLRCRKTILVGSDPA